MNATLPGAWTWIWQVYAPTGEAIPGAIGATRDAAIRSVFPDIRDWPYAVMNGYTVKSLRVEVETEAA